MRYISEIRTSQGDKSDGLILFNRDFYVTVHDTSSNTDEKIAGVLLKETDAWGYADIAVYGNPAVVCHNDKTAKLHEYVDFIETEPGTGKVIAAGIDSCVLSTNKKTFLGEKKHAVVAMDTKDDTVATSKNRGTVVTKQVGFLGGVSVMTLYDILIQSCRALGVDLMAYEVIIFHSEQAHYVTTIRLSQSAEAKRFFLKMYLEAVRRC